MGFLDYLALFLIGLSVVVVFYTFIYIHDLPHTVAKSREHPHEEAIHVACWLSLFTLHAIWPLVFIWAVSHKKQAHALPLPAPQPGVNGDAAHRLALLEERLRKLEGAAR
jgi:Na+/H+ antiporter NhaD/arsenite permease-like protein